METTIIDTVLSFFGFIGFGIVLHFYAFGIAWGAAKGWAKVNHVTTMNWNTPTPINQDNLK